MGVFIITLISSIILGAASFTINYVPLNPNYLPYFDPAFNPQDPLTQSASTNYLIPVIKPSDKTTNSDSKTTEISIEKSSYLPLPRNPKEAIANDDYLVPPLPQDIGALEYSASQQKENIDANGEAVAEDFGKRITEINQMGGVQQSSNGNSGYRNMDSPIDNRKKSQFTIIEEYGYNPDVAQEKSSDSEEAYYREIEKQAEIETEKKFRESRKNQPSYVASKNIPSAVENVASSYQIQHSATSPAHPIAQSYYVQNSGAVNPVAQSYLALNQNTQTTNNDVYQNQLVKKPRSGRKLEQKLPDTFVATNDWEPISAPYEHKAEDHGGEVHYHQHKHIHKHSHHQDHKHHHDQEHKHIHDSDHNHGHSHKESHDHSHDDSHNHSHDHHQTHTHDHHESHKHAQDHKHQHVEAHKHDHTEAHKHNSDHKHDHGHDHHHSDDHKHDHHHGHKHSHHNSHAHDHKHGHKHSHDHGHKHNHDQDHKHVHDHGHKHGHKHDHKHGHKHSKH